MNGHHLGHHQWQLYVNFRSRVWARAHMQTCGRPLIAHLLCDTKGGTCQSGQKGCGSTADVLGVPDVPWTLSSCPAAVGTDHALALLYVCSHDCCIPDSHQHTHCLSLLTPLTVSPVPCSAKLMCPLPQLTDTAAGLLLSTHSAPGGCAWCCAVRQRPQVRLAACGGSKDQQGRVHRGGKTRVHSRELRAHSVAHAGGWRRVV